MSKRILVLFHLNFLRQDRGCSVYLYQILKVLQTHHVQIDFFATDLTGEDFSDFYSLNTKEHLISSFYLHQTRNGASEKIWDYLQKIAQTGTYDFIYAHYIQWADVLKRCQLPPKTKVIYGMHDLNFIQCFYEIGFEGLEQRFENEIKALEIFDKITAISMDELFFLKHFYPQKPFYFLPPPVSVSSSFALRKPSYDLLLIGANNLYNLEGLVWFLEQVMPLFHTSPRLTICGKVNEILEEKYPQLAHWADQSDIRRIPFAPDLDRLYADHKVAIVPIFKGTGMKIKTIDAMARNVPVVTTSLGVDGFPDKTQNGCLVADQPKLFAHHIEKLLTDEKFYVYVCQQSKTYFEHNLSLEKATQTLKTVFELS